MRLIAVLFVCICLASCQRPPQAVVTTGAGMRFLALGDSYTIGESVDALECWPMQLATHLRARGVKIDDPEIIAKTGWTTDELSAGIDRADPKSPYSLVTLQIGVNNQFRGRSLEEFRTQFAALLKRAIGFAGGDTHRVVVLSIPDWGSTPFAAGQDRIKIGKEIDAFNSASAEECAKQNVAFVDITPISKQALDDKTLVAPDGLHPSSKMYSLWNQAALATVRKALDAK